MDGPPPRYRGSGSSLCTTPTSCLLATWSRSPTPEPFLLLPGHILYWERRIRFSQEAFLLTLQALKFGLPWPMCVPPLEMADFNFAKCAALSFSFSFCLDFISSDVQFSTLAFFEFAWNIVVYIFTFPPLNFFTLDVLLVCGIGFCLIGQAEILFPLQAIEATLPL